MNKIYTFTLKGEDYPSDRFNSNLRLFAHMLYESVYTYYDEYNNPLDVDKNIVYNRIHDNVYDSGYYLDSDVIEDDRIDYEPFIVGSNTFGFTINEELMSREIIDELVLDVKNLLNFDYEVVINFFDYIPKNKNEKKSRRDAIRLVFRELGCHITKKCGLVRRIINYGNKRRGIV